MVYFGSIVVHFGGIVYTRGGIVYTCGMTVFMSKISMSTSESTGLSSTRFFQSETPCTLETATPETSLLCFTSLETATSRTFITRQAQR